MGLIPNYAVRYNSDPRLVTDNHKSEIIFLLDVDERNFDDHLEAILFLGECTSPITKIEELVPELKKLGNFQWILPESHITPKHVIMDNFEDVFTNEDKFHWK